jgi:hypothetical protein
MKPFRVVIFVFAGFMTLLTGAISPPSRALSKPFPFPDLPGWKLSGEIETFSPETLFDYIDGGADAFLRYDFEELAVAQYENGKGGSLTIEVYRHRTPSHAFGIYSQERPPDPKLVQIGAQGYAEKDLLNFVAGPYYLKLSTFNVASESEMVLTLAARRVAEALGEKTSLPPLLSFFPLEGKRMNSEAFIARNFLGYPFLHSAYTAEYEAGGKVFKLFLIQGGDEKELKLMIERYFAQLGNRRTDLTEGSYFLEDPHHGAIALHWKGRYLWGILGLSDEGLRSKYLELMERRLDVR